MRDRLTHVATGTVAPEAALLVLRELEESVCMNKAFFDSCSGDFLHHLSELLVLSPPMLDSLRAHPEWLEWLKTRVDKLSTAETFDPPSYELSWQLWVEGDESRRLSLEGLRAFRRREYLEIAYLDFAGLASFDGTVVRLSALADWIVSIALLHCWSDLSSETLYARFAPPPEEGFAVIAMGKLGGRELNYSSDIDLIFCRRDSESSDDNRFYTRLGERLVQALSQSGAEGFLYRVDMRLRPHGATGPLVPTLASMVNYYESWGEAWERQALIKSRYVAGDSVLAERFVDFASSFTFARQMDDSSLEEIKRVKHRSEKEYALEPDRIHLKQGLGGIRDIEFYVQYLQLIAGWQHPATRAGSTLEALNGLGMTGTLLEGEESQLALAYLFLRTLEHRLQLRSLTPDAVMPQESGALSLFARALGFEDGKLSAGEHCLTTLGRYRGRVRSILERIYLTPGYVRLEKQEAEFAQLLSERVPRARVREILGEYGFQDVERAWQNIRSMGLGPSGHLLPPGERRAFLGCIFPLLEVLRHSIDPDLALNNLESFASAVGNRVSFLRSLASRRPHLARLSNLLALSNLCHRILIRHPEYFDSLARGIHLHEGREWEDMYGELLERIGASPRGEKREIVLRRFRQREMIRIAYRDLAGLAGALEISRELSHLAEASVTAATSWTRPPSEVGVIEAHDTLTVVALGKLGSRQMHYASDLDLMFLYDAPSQDESATTRAAVQNEHDNRVERVLELMAGVTPEGVTYALDLRLRPEGTSGLLARTWESFLEHAHRYMQPWERMALIRSRILNPRGEIKERWDSILSEVVYEHDWNEEAFGEIRHLKRRIEKEKNKESRSHLDFKYGRGGIADLEFLVQFLQILYGKRHIPVRTPRVLAAVPALAAAGALSVTERDALLKAHTFQRRVENRYQLLEEWALMEISRESPLLERLARSLGYKSASPGEARRLFLADWEEMAETVRELVERYFYCQ